VLPRGWTAPVRSTLTSFRHGEAGMFTNFGTIAKVVVPLETRNVSLWHACQLRDLDAYFQAGGVPSRQFLERRRLSFTPFVTDATDRRSGVWSKVFVNLADFGASFARGYRAVPNPYGPIALQLRPTALLEASDVAICLRSAGASDFDRPGESLSQAEDVDRLFAYPPAAGVFKAMEPLFGDRLRDAFAPKYPNATAPEASLSLKAGRIGMGYLVAVWVDPVVVDDHLLIDEVRARFVDDVPIQPRWMTDERRVVYEDIQRVIADEMPPRLRLLQGRTDVSAETRAWAASVDEIGLEWQFERFVGYLRDGTLDVLRSGRGPGPESRRMTAPISSSHAGAR
jgi:hypothetical protein